MRRLGRDATCACRPGVGPWYSGSMRTCCGMCATTNQRAIGMLGCRLVARCEKRRDENLPEQVSRTHEESGDELGARGAAEPGSCLLAAVHLFTRHQARPVFVWDAAPTAERPPRSLQ